MSQLLQAMESIRLAADDFTRNNTTHPLYEPVNYILSLGGKRLRPALSLLSCELFGGDSRAAIRPALGIEVFHNFTLMHDDIMDQAPIRRGKATVHTKWDVNTAILSGDAMLVQAYQLIAATPSEKLPEVLALFNQTALEVCEGQQMDMAFESRDDVTVAEYLEMIRLKTSVLLAAALRLGALLGEASAREQELIYRFGESLGMAFQLRDDYLDAFGETDKVGKQEGGDILSDKKTYLLIRAIESAGVDQRAVLNHYIGNRQADDAEKVTRVKGVFREIGVDQELLDLSDTYFGNALQALNEIQRNHPALEELREFAAQLMVRDH